MESRSLKSRSGAYAINVVKQIAWAGVYVIIALLILSGQSRAGSLACPTYSRINTYYACTAYVDYQYQWYSGAWTGPSNPAGGFQLGDYRWPSASQSAYHNAPGAIVNTVVFTHVWGGSGGPNATATTYIIPTQPITSVGCPTTVAVGANFTCTPTYSYNAPGGTSAWAAGGMTSVTPGTFKATAPGAKTVTLTQTWGTLTNTLTQNITAMVPPTITSLGCSTNAITGMPTICTPVVTGGDPAMTYAFSGADTIAGNTLTFTTPGSKTVTYTATYPGVGVLATSTQVITVATPTATITEINCPVDVITGKTFACTPVTTSNVPGVVFTWTGDGVTATGNNLLMKYPGAYPVTLTASYPGSTLYTNLAIKTQSVNVITPVVTVSSLGCPVDVVLNHSFPCTPVFTSNLPAAYKADERLTWASPSGIVANGNLLTFSAGGERVVNLTVSYPGAGGTGTNTQNVNVISPAVLISSVGCPAGAIVGTPITCTPVFTAAFPVEYQTDQKITWTGADVVNGNNLTFTGEGSKTVTLNISYPDVGGTGTSSQSVSAVIPSVTVLSLGCPSDTLLNRAFTCNPVFSTNLPAPYKTDETLVWSGDNMTANGNVISYASAGAKDLTLTVSYPLSGNSGTKTSSVMITEPSAPVTSLGCPANVATGKSFTCNPVTTSNVIGTVYSWASSEDMTVLNNTLTFSTPGTKTITYSGVFSDFGVIGTNTQTVNVITPEVTVSTAGCPAKQDAFASFSCTPVVTSNLPEADKSTAIYTYSSSGLLFNAKDSTMQFNTSGTKTIAVGVRYPGWEGVSATGNQAIEVAAPIVTLTSLGCPATQSAFAPFTCVPIKTTNVPEAYQTGAQYTWTGLGLIVNTDGSLQYNGSGPKTISLSIRYPATGSVGTQSQDIEITNPEVAVTSLGCPEQVTALQSFNCTPVVVTALPKEYQTGAQYTWSGDEGVQINNTSGAMVINSVGSKKVSLQVKYPAAAGVTSGIQNQQVLGVAPAVSVTGMNCPARIQANTPFKCEPKITTALPMLLQGNRKHTYSGDGLQSNADGSLQFKTSGEKIISLGVTYPLFEGAVGNSTQAMVIGETSLKITSLGCPATALTTKAITCNPSVATSIPAINKSSAVYTWSGDGVQSNEDGTLSLSGEGVRTVTLTVSYPSYEASTSATQSISVTEPKLSITSLGCPTDVLAGQSFSCKPAVVANLPSAFLTGVKYAWSGDGLVVSTNGSLQFTGDGSKTIKLTVDYPLAGSTMDKSSDINIVTATAEISSLNCPTSALINEKFSCKPVYTTNLPDSFKINSRLVWTGEGLKVNAMDGSLTFSTSGTQKAISLAVVYPLAGNLQSTATGQMEIGSLDMTINSLGCPSSVDSQVPFKCAPAVTASLPAEMQGDIQYAWAGTTLNTTTDGSLSLTGTGSQDVTLTASVKGRPISVKRTEAIAVRSAAIGISSLGCPDRAVSQMPFACTPVLATSLAPEQQSALQYSWVGDGLATGTDSSMTFASAGVGKKVTLKVVDPSSGLKIEKAGTMIVDPLAVAITTIRCPSPLRQDTPFTCVPVVSTNLPNHLVSDMTYTWSGAGLLVNGDGSFKFNTPGSQSVTLTINQPQFNLTATKTLPVSVTAAALKIKSLGCPGYITEYTPFTCNPVITTDSVTGTDAIKYQWQINGNLVSTDKKLYINSPDASAATVDIVLTAAITEGTAGNEIAKNVGSQTIKINPNKTKLSLTVTAPKMAETGTEITLSAGTKFQTPSMVDYQWTINNKLYSGSVVKYAVNAGEPEGITYSVTAQPSCCSSIPAETKTGKITVASYAFPVITLTGPAQSIANIAPYKASFKLAVVNKINEAMTYAWDFGDGTGGTATTPIAVSHLYSQPGTYNVVLTATDTRGGSNQYTTDVTVGTLPERNVEIKGIMSNKYSRAPVSGYFKYNISGGLNTDSPVSSLWSINGQTIGNKAYVTQLFPQAGTYNLQLDVATRFGNNISAVLPVTVKENQAPMCTITKKLVMAKQYQLYANCVDTDGKIVAYKWDLGNGSTSQTVNASVRYTASGVYTISLTATDDSGAVVTVEDALSVD